MIYHKKSTNETKILKNFILKYETVDALHEFCVKQGLGLGRTVDLAIQEYIANHSKGE